MDIIDPRPFPETWITVEQAAVILGVTELRIRKWVDRGKLPRTKWRRRYWFDPEIIRALIPPPPPIIPGRHVTLEVAAAWAGTTISALRMRIVRGKMPAIKWRGKWWVEPLTDSPDCATVGRGGTER